MRYKTNSKLEKHQAYIEYLKERIELLKWQKEEIEKELIALRIKLDVNKDYVPEE